MLIALQKAGEELLLDVRLARRCRILEEQNVGGGGDDAPATPTENAVRKIQALRKKGGLVVVPVALGVFENPHASTRLALAVHPQRVIRHLHHPKSPPLVPVKSHGIKD